ncbi:MAG: phage holin family protein [Candidatus Komeilibacteria bacterium]|nr:phage holin family protein [Candidatus Komeilibacteria bacterium]
MNILINWLIMSLAILATAYVLPGVALSGFGSALVVALVLGILNTFIKPLLIILTLPINILTLGLFTFVINALLIMLTSAMVPGFMLEGFLTALIFSIILSIIVYLLHLIFA